MAGLWVEMRRAWRDNTPLWQLPGPVVLAYLGIALALFGVTALLVGLVT